MTIVVFLGEKTLPWLAIDGEKIVSRGNDEPPNDTPIVAIASARKITYHVCDFTSLTLAQAAAAARHEAGDFSLGDLQDRHVALTFAKDGFVVTSKASVAAMIEQLGAAGLTPIAIIPTPSILPVPLDGFVRANFSFETVLRSSTLALVDDGPISALVVGDAPVETMDRDAIEAAIIAAVGAPPLNLLQGEFGPRTRWAPERPYWRRIGIYAGILAALTLAIALSHWARLAGSTAAIETKTTQIAADALGQGEAGPQSFAQLQAKVADQRGAGAGFQQSYGAILRAIESHPSAELAAMDFDATGVARTTVRAANSAELEAIGRSIAANGFSVSRGPEEISQGRVQAVLMVSVL